MTDPGAILITGCSSGIGRAAAERLAQRGCTVYATARRPESIADLKDRGCRTLQLDVCDEASMQAAVAAVESDHGVVGVLVNNAGYAQIGTVEEIDMGDLREQFETNVFGLTRMCQLVLPAMRRHGAGRIVNISSGVGKMTLPNNGAYCATKHAVEAISDALRFEVGGFGIDVVVIEPGLIKTGFNDAALEHMGDSTGEDTSPYAALHARARKVLREAYDGKVFGPAASVDDVAEVVEQVALTPHPKTRYVITLPAKASLALKWLLPDAAWDRIVLGRFGN